MMECSRHSQLMALCVGLALLPARSLAQERVVIPAPASTAPPPAWLDNAVTRRFVAWQKLDAEWKALSAARSQSDFVSQAARICLAAAEMPREGEPQPGMRARLLKEACGGALSVLSECYARAGHAVSHVAWQREFAFELPARTQACGSAQSLVEVAKHAQEITGASKELEAARAVLANELAEIERAREGQQTLALPACERAGQLRAIFERIPAPEPSAKTLASTQTQKQLRERWNASAQRGASYDHVVAYHLAEAQIELETEAEQRAAAARSSGDIALALQARDDYACLQRFRDAKPQLAAAEKQLKALQARADKEAACLADPACIERREAREQRRIERDLMHQQAEEERVETRSCCKVCSTGYACGDSCISRSKSCHKGPGCACDE